MPKFMKPKRLNVDPNSSTAANERKHKLKLFENYLMSFPKAERNAIDEWQILANCLAFEAYNYVEDCTTNDEAEGSVCDGA